MDSFGELRDEKDSAIEYRTQRNFITDIPYSKVSRDKMPDPLHYLYFLLHLDERKRKYESETAPEAHVRQNLDEGNVDWRPMGTSLAASHLRDKDKEMAGRVDGLTTSMQNMAKEMQEMAKAIQVVKEAVTKASDGVG